MKTNLEDRAKRFFGRLEEGLGLFGAVALDAALPGGEARKNGGGRGVEGKVLGAREKEAAVPALKPQTFLLRNAAEHVEDTQEFEFLKADGFDSAFFFREGRQKRHRLAQMGRVETSPQKRGDRREIVLLTEHAPEPYVVGGVRVNVVDERLKLDGFDTLAEPFEQGPAVGREALKAPAIESGAGQEYVTIGHLYFFGWLCVAQSLAILPPTCIVQCRL